MPDMNPVSVSDATLAYPADVGALLPSWEAIPEEFKEAGFEENEWTSFASHWFRHGLAGTTEFYCKEGIDGETAVRHLRAILGSFQPKHEHKLAGAAYLCSLWFDKVEHYKVPTG